MGNKCQKVNTDQQGVLLKRRKRNKHLSDTSTQETLNTLSTTLSDSRSANASSSHSSGGIGTKSSATEAFLEAWRQCEQQNTELLDMRRHLTFEQLQVVKYDSSITKANHRLSVCQQIKENGLRPPFTKLQSFLITTTILQYYENTDMVFDLLQVLSHSSRAFCTKHKPQLLAFIAEREPLKLPVFGQQVSSDPENCRHFEWPERDN